MVGMGILATACIGLTVARQLPSFTGFPQNGQQLQLKTAYVEGSV